MKMHYIAYNTNAEKHPATRKNVRADPQFVLQIGPFVHRDGSFVL